MGIITHIIVPIATILFSTGVGVYFHELGHVIAYKKATGITPKMKFKYDCRGLKNDDYRLVLKSGVVLGLVAAMVTLQLINAIIPMKNYVMVSILLLYLFGSRDDILNWIKTKRATKSKNI